MVRHHRALALPVAIALLTTPLRAQCPDGTPPPCSARLLHAAPAATNSVAVLYFDNVTRDSNDTYLADGLTEEIIGRLSAIDRLAVKSHFAVRRYRGSDLEDLAPVARALGALVRPGGYVAICTIGRFCAWEMLYYKKALRRLPGRSGDVYYPTVRQLRAHFGTHFELRFWTGVGMLVPPSYVNLPAGIVNLLARLDRLPFLRSCADHRLLVFRRK